MTTRTQQPARVRWLIAGALVVFALGAAVTYVLMRRSGEATSSVAPSAVAPGGPAAAPTAEAGADAIVTLSPDMVARAGIVTSPVRTDGTAAALRLPGIVEPHGYRTAPVTPLVAGRVSRVFGELGMTVSRGQPLAEVFSPDVAQAQNTYVSARARLDAHDRELQRTHALVEIGAASRQELERLHAEHTELVALLDSARARLELFGLLTPAAAAGVAASVTDAIITIRAPIDGVLTDRSVNTGQNVGPDDRLFTIADLSAVWVVADLYEADMARIRVGHQATVTVAAFPDLVLRGRVTYIDPQLNAATRTARLRVEVPNERQLLRLGMYVTVSVRDSAGPATVAIPRGAVQQVGGRTVAYVARPGEPGQFTERAIVLGPTSDGQVQVRSGLEPGDAVVTEGSFFVRAERERTGAAPGSRETGPRDAVQSAAVTVSANGFQPSEVSFSAGHPARLIFTRTTDQTCATAVLVPSLGVRRDLPLNQPVTIEFTPAAGTIAFACGMDMFRGTIVVR